MHRSPRMIPSRTVFNHCKWIYIELAITGAHSGMGPLCISPAPTPAARARASVFPISSLRTTPTAATPRLPESSLVLPVLHSPILSLLSFPYVLLVPLDVMLLSLRCRFFYSRFSFSQHSSLFRVDLFFFFIALQPSLFSSSLNPVEAASSSSSRFLLQISHFSLFGVLKFSLISTVRSPSLSRFLFSFVRFLSFSLASPF